jgi:hypothetical protein
LKDSKVLKWLQTLALFSFEPKGLIKTNDILTLVMFCDAKHLKHYEVLSQTDLMQSMEIWMQEVEYENLFILAICGNQ